MSKNPETPKYFSMTPLGRLCAEQKISISDLANLAGSASRTSMHRLLCGDLDARFESRIFAALASTLPQWLLAHGMSKTEIDARLINIFPEGEYQPMINTRIELTTDECRWFGLSKDPFAGFPESRGEVYICPPLQRIVDRVIDAIKYPAFISVTGPIGSGKTVIRAMVEDYVAQQSNIHVIWPEFFDQSRVSTMQVARAVLRHFGFVKIPRNAEDLGQQVKSCLEREFKAGNRISLAFDESHRLSDTTLSSLKNFVEMGSGGFQRWLSVLLFGQDFLNVRLLDAKFTELNERIIPNPMPDFSEYADGYLVHRLKIVGADPALFDDEAIQFIAAQAETPLQLGNIANKALRISKEKFEEHRVIGSAIKTEMFFANNTNAPQQAFRKRA